VGVALAEACGAGLVALAGRAAPLPAGVGAGTSSGAAACSIEVQLHLTARAFERAGARSPDALRLRGPEKLLREVVAWARPECGAAFLGELSEAERCLVAGLEEGGGAPHTSQLFELLKPGRGAGGGAAAAPLDAEALAPLVPEMRPYQRRAVAWMLERENAPAALGVGGAAGGELRHPLWVGVDPPDFGDGAGEPYFFNPFTGGLSLRPFPTPAPVRGGILADEMGLGKTVEVLGLVVLNPFRGGGGRAGGANGGSEGPAMAGGAADGEGKPPPGAAVDPGPGGEVKQEPVEPGGVACSCGAEGAPDEPGAPGFGGLWVQCTLCGTWQHGGCVGYKSPAEVPEAYACGPCIRRRASAPAPGQSGATLVVCPQHILQQWREEIDRHVRPGHLRVRVFLGQSQAAGKGGDLATVVTARDLAECDVVLTTYDTLRSEIHSEADPRAVPSRSLRYPKRYEVVPTPLTRLCWWRVCMDEAQMVEGGRSGSVAAAAAMALKLQTHHRWCVTGTPVSRGVDDLYGLLLFLGARPFCERGWWGRVISEPYQDGSAAAVGRLMHFLRPGDSGRGLLWRTQKKDVRAELGLKPQTFLTERLSLSAVESHFYKRQHQECRATAMAALPRGVWAAGFDEAQDRQLNEREAKKLLHRLLLLRQACCHPQVGAQGIHTLSHQAPMTMDEILGVLISKTRLEAEDRQRLLFFSLNGLGALMQLEGNLPGAVAAYRELVATAEENERSYGVRTDALQRLHTFHNLAEALEACQTSASFASQVPRTLRDGDLRARAEKLREEYLNVARLQLAQAEHEWKELEGKVRDKSRTFTPGRGPAGGGRRAGWALEALDMLAEEDPAASEDGVVRAVKEFLAQSAGPGQNLNASSLVHRFQDMAGLKYALTGELDALATAREECVRALQGLGERCRGKPAPAFVAVSSHCFQCRHEFAEDETVCEYCRFDDLLMQYESRLFSLRTTAMVRGRKMGTNAAAAAFGAQAARRAAAGGGRLPGAGGGGGGGGGRRLGLQDDGEDLGRGARTRAREGAYVARTDVLHRPSEAELVLQYVLARLRRREGGGGGRPGGPGGNRGRLVDAGKAQLALLESLRAEFIPARTFSRSQRQWLYAHDELHMSVSRMQCVPDYDDIPAAHVNFKVHRAEVPVRNGELSAAKLVEAAELQKSLGTLRYLEGLAAARRGVGGAAGAGRLLGGAVACPVCQEEDRSEISVLPCGHSVCTPCVMALLARAAPGARRGSRRIACPTCRQVCSESEVASVYAGEDPREGGRGGDNKLDAAAEEGPKIAVKGSYGSKIECVTRTVLRLLRRDPGAKLLVFSQWSDLLDLVAHAFKANGVAFVHARERRHLAGALEDFRRGGRPASPGGQGPTAAGGATVNALLLPLRLGGNGLNITEAQHVFLVEPLLDPGLEAQAVGRVDRIGQRAETFVHRFLVEKTVEESVLALSASRALAEAHQAGLRAAGLAGERCSLTLSDVRRLLDDGAAR